MSDLRRARGAAAERAAAALLEDRGYRIVARNVRTRYGEIDLVADDRGVLVIVEVRARRADDPAAAAESVGPLKRARLARLADGYVQALPRTPASWRIDVVALALDARERVLRAEVIQNAVEG